MGYMRVRQSKKLLSGVEAEHEGGKPHSHHQDSERYGRVTNRRVRFEGVVVWSGWMGDRQVRFRTSKRTLPWIERSEREEGGRGEGKSSQRIT